MPFDARTDLTPGAYLGRVGDVFATFDARSQDSGNVSYGVEANGRRWFVKTAGDPANPAPFLPHDQRVALLRNARRLALSVSDPALPALRGVTQSAWGPMLVYDWAPGELVGTPAARRADPDCALQRFRRLPPDQLTAAIDTILDVHVKLCAAGWVACDFYDGSVMYDFTARRTWVIDLDSYREGAFNNDMGRMFGSSRFMAPEEFERGADRPAHHRLHPGPGDLGVPRRRRPESDRISRQRASVRRDDEGVQTRPGRPAPERRRFGARLA